MSSVHVAPTVPADACRVERLSAGRADGVEIVGLIAGDFIATVCPTRGMGLLDFCRRGSDGSPAIDLSWDAPIGRGPVHPSLVSLDSRGGLGWLDGFNELIARCGLSFNGPPGHDENGPPLEQHVTLHGRIANLPATSASVAMEGDAVVCRGVVHEATLFGASLTLATTITLSPDGTLRVQDVVSNPSARPQEMQLLYHINVNPLRLARSSNSAADLTLTPPPGPMQPRDETAAAGLDSWTRIDPPTPGYAEQVFFVTPEDDGSGRAATTLAGEDGQSLTVRQQLDTLPSLSIWKCFQPEADGYVLGIEPGTGFPNFKADERTAGRVVTLQPGESRSHEIELSLGGPA